MTRSKFRRIGTISLAASILLAIISSCATLGFEASESSVERVIALINSGEPEDVVTNSTIPFVFDGEILLRRRDVETLWMGLRANDFELTNPEILSIEGISESSYLLFSESREMEIHFSKHIPQGAYIAEVGSPVF